MDPQLEEYRRMQRERSQANAVESAKQAKKSNVSMILGVVLLCVAAVAWMQHSGESMGTAVALAEEVPGTAASAGVCPRPDGPGICIEECSGNSECPAGQLCCSNGCGHVCMEPVDPNKEAPARSCNLIAVVDKTKFAEVLATLPKPKDHQELKGIGMLLLNYGMGRDAECCQAADILHTNSEVSSVEYDGRPPKCAAAWAMKQQPGPEDTFGVSDDEAASMEMGIDDGAVGIEDMGIEEGL